jgi:spermidine/putrescine transport system substrate-binding protein
MTISRIMTSSAVAALLLGVAPAHAEDVLHIYNWTAYISQPLLEKFTKETGIRVSVDTFDNGEAQLAKMRSGTANYDITVASADFVPIYIREGLVQKVNIAELENYGSLDPKWKTTEWDSGNVYSIPWHWGVTSVQVDTSVYQGPTDSLSLLFQPPKELAGKVGMFSSPTEVISLALRYLGKEPCSNNNDDLRAVDRLLQEQKPFVKIYDSAGLADRQGSGETVVSQIANGEAMRARFVKPSLKFVFAKEGGVLWVDNVVVPANAPRPDLAKKFIAFIMKPENAALEQKEIGYPTGVTEAKNLLPKEVAEAPELALPADYKMVASPACSEEVLKKYDLIWTKLRQ